MQVWIKLVTIVSFVLFTFGVKENRMENVMYPIEFRTSIQYISPLFMVVAIGERMEVLKDETLFYIHIEGSYIDGRNDIFYSNDIRLKYLLKGKYFMFTYVYGNIYNGYDDSLERIGINLRDVKIITDFKVIDENVYLSSTFLVTSTDECSILLEDELFTYIAINGQYIDGKSDIFYSNDIKYKNLESGIYTFYYIYERIEYIYESLNDALFWKNGMNAKVKMVKSIDYVGALPK